MEKVSDLPKVTWPLRSEAGICLYQPNPGAHALTLSALFLVSSVTGISLMTQTREGQHLCQFPSFPSKGAAIV